MINQWEISEKNIPLLNNLIEYHKQHNNKNYLLDLNNHNISYLENFILKIALFHFKRLNINFDKTKHYVEFSFNKKIIYSDPSPILTCITNLNNIDNPIMISNLSIEMYKFKKIDNMNFVLSYPNKLTHTCFENPVYYDYNKDSLTILINVFDERPYNIFYYYEKVTENNDFDLTFIDKNNNVKTIEIDNEIHNFENLSNLIYNKNADVFTQLIKLETNTNIVNTFIFKKLKRDSSVILKKKINEMLNFDMNVSKFNQRFTIKNIFQKDICHWIINEAENYAINNGGWNKSRHKYFPTTDLPLEKIKNVFSFILHSFNNITNNIKKCYCLDDNVLFEIDDLFIIKYDVEQQTGLDLHSDQSDITVSVLLNDGSDFEGGGTYFLDELVVKLEQGDMLIHSGNVKHAGLSISNGRRYLFTAFIKLYV